MHSGRAKVHQVIGAVVSTKTKYWFIILIEPAVPAVLQKAKVLRGGRDRERFQGTVREARLFLYKMVRDAKNKYPDHLMLDVDVLVLPLGEANERNMTRARGVEELMTKLARRVLCN